MKKANQYYILSAIILGISLLIRLVNESRIVKNFPLDFANDISSHIARLSFLIKYGFHEVIPNWYHGFNYILFESYPPGWYFFAKPFALIFGEQLGTYLSMITLFAIAFIIIYFVIGKLLKISPVKRILFYLLFFASPTAIGNLIRVGKMPELTGWVLAILLFGIIFYYKDKEIKWPFYFTTIILAALILSSPSVLVIMSIPYIGLLLIKNNKERIQIIASAVIAFIISSFWLIGFVKSSFTHTLASTNFTEWLLIPGITADKLAIIGMSIVIIGLSSYYIYKKGKNQALFFAPFIIAALLIITKLIIHIPIFNQAYLDTYTLLFLLTSITIIFTIKIPKEHLFAIALIIAVIGISFASISYTQFYAKENTQEEKDVLSILGKVEGVFHFPENDKIYSKAVYSYGALEYDTKAIRGWYDQGIREEDLEKIKDIPEPEECEGYYNYLSELGVEEVVTAEDECEVLKNCGFKPEITEGKACLFKIEN